MWVPSEEAMLQQKETGKEGETKTSKEEEDGRRGEANSRN